MKTVDGDEVTDENRFEKKRRWGFWNPTYIGDGKTTYLARISIITTPWFSIKLHRIYRPDNQRDLHDHPWDFVSFLLLGYYVEDVPHKHDGWDCCDETTEPRLIRWMNVKRAEDQHSISWVSRSPVWTLVFCGPARRQWGFWTKYGWVPWHKYNIDP